MTTLTFLIITCTINLMGRLLGINHRSPYLFCGLFGGSGMLDLSKIAFLGKENDSRGGDGTGYFYGNHIEKGIGTLKKFYDLVSDSPIIKRENATVFIGHTRKSTVGAHSEENTHPFQVGKMLVLAHNGQIYNAKTMCEKYDIDHTKYTVDSHMLAALIHKVGFKQILTEYIGYAALAFVYLDKPDVLYLYHGASREYASALKPEEERPLFFLQARGCVYFSSLEQPLKFIRENKKQKPVLLPHNTVYLIENGKFKGAKYKIDREETNLDIYKAKFPANHTKKSSTYGYDDVDYSNGWPNYNNRAHNNGNGYNEKMRNQIAHNNMRRVNAAASTPPFQPNLFDINMESLNPNSLFRYNDKVLFYWKGRHWVTEEYKSTFELVNGIYYADKDTGYWERWQPISMSTSDEPSSDQIKNGFSLRYPDERKTMFKNKGVDLKIYFFYKGMMIASREKYDELQKRLFDEALIKGGLIDQINNPVLNVAHTMSYYTKYPVTLLTTESDGVKESAARRKWYFNGKPANWGNQKPQFSNCKYTIIKGFLTKHSLITDETKPVSATPMPSDLVVHRNPNIPILLPPSKNDLPIPYTYNEKENRLNLPHTEKAKEELEVQELIAASKDKCMTFDFFDLLPELLINVIEKWMGDQVDVETSDFNMHPERRKGYVQEKITEMFQEMLNKDYSIHDYFLEHSQTAFIDLEGYIRTEVYDKYHSNDEPPVVEQSKFNFEEDVPYEKDIEPTGEREDEAAEEAERQADLIATLAAEQDADCIEYVKMFIEDDDLHESALIFQQQEESAFGQEIANIIFKHNESLQNSIKEIAEKYKQPDIVTTVLKSQKIIK